MYVFFFQAENGIRGRVMCLEFRRVLFQSGMSPEQYIIDFRLKKARDFLLLTPYTISQIAYSTGFKDPGYFCRVFKKHLGISPKNFRTENPPHHL